MIKRMLFDGKTMPPTANEWLSGSNDVVSPLQFQSFRASVHCQASYKVYNSTTGAEPLSLNLACTCTCTWETNTFSVATRGPTRKRVNLTPMVSVSLCSVYFTVKVGKGDSHAHGKVHKMKTMH